MNSTGPDNIALDGILLSLLSIPEGVPFLEVELFGTTDRVHASAAP